MRRGTVVTLGSPGLRAGMSPVFLVFPGGWPRSGRSRMKKGRLQDLKQERGQRVIDLVERKDRDHPGHGSQGVRNVLRPGAIPMAYFMTP